MKKDVTKYLTECDTCLACKEKTGGPVPIGSYPISSAPFERLVIDILTGFETTRKGNKNLLVCIDSLTRYTELIPLKSKTAQEVAMKLFERIICRYSVPKVLISDNGGEFNNKILQTLCEKFMVKKVNITAYHPASNGLA